MLCGLCLEESTKYNNLYDSNCQKNDIYETILLYFPEELGKQSASISNCSNVVCFTCWSIISAYDELRQRVNVAQLNLKNVKTSETTIKLEEVDIEFANFADADNLASSEPQIDVLFDKNDNLDPSLEDLKLIAEDNFPDSENNDGDDDDHNDPSFRNENAGEDGDANEIESGISEDDEDNVPLSTIIKNKNFLKKVRSVNKLTKGRPRKSKNLKQKKDTNTKGKSLQHIKSAESDKFIADWKDTLPCDICEYSAENFTLLRRHFKDVHAAITPYVKCCGKKYIKRIRLVEHIRKHLDPESFKCPECGKCSANSDCLAKHIKTAHGPDSREKKFKCDVCQKAFAQQSVLKRHMDVHAIGQKDHICPHCDKGFVLEKRLQIHIKNIHCATCVCELCGRSFRNPYALKDHHMLEHEGVEKPKWPCDQCSAQLKSKYNLTYHKRTVHNDGSTLYECSECGKVALSEGALLRHKRNVHAAPRKFKCTICDKAFKVAQVLKEHMTIHTGEELYTCPHCPKTFRVNANMHHHRKRVHPKEWAEKRSERPFIPNTDISHVSQKVVI